jgi:hypothetical protein
MTKKGKKPENKPTKGTMTIDSLSEKIKFPKNNIDIIITNRIFGINDEIVSPYSDDTNICFRLGLISSSLILRTIMAVINPIEKHQNSILIILFTLTNKK